MRAVARSVLASLQVLAITQDKVQNEEFYRSRFGNDVVLNIDPFHVEKGVSEEMISFNGKYSEAHNALRLVFSKPRECDLVEILNLMEAGVLRA